MRFKLVVSTLALMAACGAAVALAAHPKVDPAAVPTGFFAAHSRVSDVPTAAIRRALRTRRTDLFLEHVRLDADEATGFRTHPGPVFVMVAAGSVTYEDAVRGECRRKTYGRDAGFVDRGRHVHRLVAGSAGADFYAVYLLPRRTGPNLTPAATPRECRA